MKNITARLIGEHSAGMTAVQIYNGDRLVWSHEYFTDGATHQEYIDRMHQAYDDMVSCADYAQYEGCDYNDDMSVHDYDDGDTTGVDLVYDNGEWTIIDPTMHGQNMDFLRYNRDRLPRAFERLAPQYTKESA